MQTPAKLRFLLPLLMVGAASMPATASPRRPGLLTFAKDEGPVRVSLVRPDTADPYLKRFRDEFRPEAVVAGAKTDLERVKALLKWVHGRWEHDGSRRAKKRDPISILREAAAGGRFCALEYALVLAGAANALGLPARTVQLDLEDTTASDCMQVVEVFLRDDRRWVMADGQWDAIPILKGTRPTPLDAVEFQQALAEGRKGLTILSSSGTDVERYFDWIAPYLFYFGTRVDPGNGPGTGSGERFSKVLTLAPLGASEPRGKLCTHCVADLYPRPDGPRSEAKLPTLSFSKKHGPVEVNLVRPDTADPYLKGFRDEFQLEAVVAGATTDLDRVRALSSWVHDRWEHDGNNRPEKEDPVSILRDVAAGKRFCCVDYGIVLAGAANALGLPARVLGLMREDTSADGACHVVAEVFLRDQHKWIMADAQWDAIPIMEGKPPRPLSAVELQEALAKRRKGLAIATGSGTEVAEYFGWVEPYLFYFDTRVDPGNGPGTESGVRSSTGLMLVPLGAKEPTNMWPASLVSGMLYTHCIADLYPKPGVAKQEGCARP